MIALLELAGSLLLEAAAPTTTLPLEAEPCVSGLAARRSRVIGTARVTAVHDCADDFDARSAGLAIRSADRWFFQRGGLVHLERVSSNIIRRVRFVREHLDAGELADGTKAAIYTVETMNGTAGAVRVGHVLVCSVGPTIACAEPLAFACDENSCTAPRMSRGILVVRDADEGEQRYAVTLSKETAPPR